MDSTSNKRKLDNTDTDNTDTVISISEQNRANKTQQHFQQIPAPQNHILDTCY